MQGGTFLRLHMWVPRDVSVTKETKGLCASVEGEPLVPLFPSLDLPGNTQPGLCPPLCS